MELSSLTYLEPIRNTALRRKILWLLAIFTVIFAGWPLRAFSQYDYVPGMKKFPDINITHYDLHAEFFPDTIIVKAKAIVEFQLKEAKTDLVIFEIDRRVKILRANDGNRNPLRFEQPDDSDYVVIHLAEPIEIVAIHKDKKHTNKVLVEGRENPFQFEVDFKPDTVLLDPEYKVLRWDDDIRVWLYTSRGRKLVHNKKYKEAEKLLDRALQISPNCSWAALERAAVAELQDQIELALRFYLQAIDGDMNFHLIPWPHEQLIQVLYLSVGYCYDLLGKRQKAVTWYQKVIQTGRDPRFAFYYDKAQEYLKKPVSKKK